MQKAKGNHHKMSKTPEGSPSSADVKNNTPEGSSSNADVKNNSEKLPVFGKLGQAAVRAAVRVAESAADYLNRVAETGEKYINEHTGADAGKSTSEKSETLATSASNDAKKGKADNSQGKNASEGAKSTPEKQDSNANKPEAKKGKADASQGKNAGGGAKSTSKKQAPDTNESKTEKSKVNTPQVEKTSDGTKSTSEGTTDTSKPNAKPEAKKSKDDAFQGKNASGAAADFMKKFLDESKQDQGSSAAGSSEDKQDKDSNPNTGEAQTKETRTSPEKREAATNLKYAKDRHSKASAAAKSKSPFGRKRRQEELNAATEELKKCDLAYKAAVKLDESRERVAKASVDVESHFFKRKKRQEELNAATEELKKSGLEYMRLKFADKIEAAKQDPEKQAELAAEMAQAAFASMQETSRTTTDKYDSMLDDRGKFKKAVAKVGKWFNKGGKIAQWLKLGGAGFAGGAIVGSVATWPITTAVGIVTGLGVAGATKQAVLEEHRGEDRIDADANLGTIDPSFEKAVANMKIDDVMEHAVNVSVDNLKDVSIERQDDLRKRMRRAMGRFGIGFALGGFAGKFIGDWANSAHATGPESNTTTPSQSGGEQIPQSGGEQVPQSGGASSVDSPVDKIVNSVNPDTSNFNSYDYPWDWAAEKFGDANAMDQLHNLADKAMADGHTVQWFDGPGGTWMKVDGSSATEHVLGVLSRYV